MPCYKPLCAYRQKTVLSAKPTIVFGREHLQFYDAPSARKLLLPCGQCIGCRLERSRRWAVRLMHEASLHERNSFITLTYDQEHVPKDGSLKVRDFQLFMKKLRRGSSGPLRFFHCGEYGEKTGRPHYHVCLFGENFSDDRNGWSITKQGNPLFTSKRLSEVWGNGQAFIGELTFESAAYVARYCLKKVTGEKAEAHYQGRRPEYVTMSRRPGIGQGWFQKWAREVYPSDSVVMRGREMLPPPYYDKLLEAVDPGLFKRVKEERSRERPESHELSHSEWSEVAGPRVQVREEVKTQTINHTLTRKYE